MIEPLDFHKTAEFLKDQKEEWHVRTVVNRSYYGVFLYLRDFLAREQVNIPNPAKKSQHRFVIQCFEKSKTVANQKKGKAGESSGSKDKIDHKAVLQIYNMLKTLFRERINADYRLDLRFPHNDSADSLRRARITIETLDNLSGSATEKLISNESKRYGEEQARLLASKNS